MIQDFTLTSLMTLLRYQMITIIINSRAITISDDHNSIIVAKENHNGYTTVKSTLYKYFKINVIFWQLGHQKKIKKNIYIFIFNIKF